MINFEEFQKIDLKIGKILEAEKVENSEKLLKLKVDLGEEQRQIIAGIGKVYQPQDLINQEIVVVVNLEPKTLMGFKSQGMLLAADNNGEPILIKPEKEVLPGTKIH
jgi:methionine--tRNA ligase beta chain